ncbi:hypothetical protein [Dyadobacter sp. NIV53]|uniref:hypothetical protein n=1 Tax=Dyadobacter sp. NIV53 TaxID=2861765 RepID=UPI001C87296D|nr:hypothetical protein [Dyadobacter sp. NIV53]
MKTHNQNNCNKKKSSFIKLYFILALIFFQYQEIYAQLKLVPIGEMKTSGAKKVITRQVPEQQHH